MLRSCEGATASESVRRRPSRILLVHTASLIAAGPIGRDPLQVLCCLHAELRQCRCSAARVLQCRTDWTGTGTYDAACMVMFFSPFWEGVWAVGRSREGTGGWDCADISILLPVESSVWKTSHGLACQTAAIVRQTSRHVRVARQQNDKAKKKKKTVDRQTGEINPQQRKKCVSKRWTTTTRPCRAHHLGCRPHCWDRDLCAVSSSEANGTCRRPPAREQDKTAYHLLQCVIPYHTTQIFRFLPCSCCCVQAAKHARGMISGGYRNEGSRPCEKESGEGNFQSVPAPPRDAWGGGGRGPMVVSEVCTLARGLSPGRRGLAGGRGRRSTPCRGRAKREKGLDRSLTNQNRKGLSGIKDSRAGPLVCTWRRHS